MSPPHKTAVHAARPHPDGIFRAVRAKLTGFIRVKSPAWWVQQFAKLLAAVYISHFLQSLTDAALWLPVEWREGILFGSSFAFLVFSALVETSFKHFFHLEDHPKKHAAGINEKSERFAPTLFSCAMALGFLGVFGYSLYQSNQLNSVSVWTFVQTDKWWWDNYGPTNNLAVELDKKLAGSGKTGTYAPAAASKEQKSGEASREAAYKFNPPPFVNKDKQRIFFPDQIDDPWLTEYLGKLGAQALHSKEMGAKSNGTEVVREGIRIALDREPIRLIDWSETQGYKIRRIYTYKFLRYHVIMILCVAGAWGAFQKRGEFALESLIDIVFPHTKG